MKVVLAALLLAGAGFAGGWFARAQGDQDLRCFAVPGQTETSQSLLRPRTAGPELVCK